MPAFASTTGLGLACEMALWIEDIGESGGDELMSTDSEGIAGTGGSG
jgi:hypothetical protein